MKLYQTIFGILIHVTIIAIFEILFYFFYIAKLEKEATDRQVSCLLPKELVNIRKNINNKNIKILEDFLRKKGVPIPTEINKDTKYITLLLNHLTSLTHKKASKSKKDRNEHNNKLFLHAGIIALILVIIIIAWFFIGPILIKQKNYKIDWKELLYSILIIIILIAIFEIYFVKKIVLKYGVTSSEETKEILVDTINGDNVC